MKHLLLTLLTLMLSLSVQADDEWRDTVQFDVGHPQMFHLRNNTIYDVLLVPNLGFEFALGRRFSWVFEAGLGWWSINRKHRFWRVATTQMELRYWRNWETNTFRYRGHHFGIYAAAYRYDFEFGGTGYQADFNYGGGFSWGYAARLSRKLSLDFTLGVGYIGGKYRKYDPVSGQYLQKSTVTRHYVGPSKLELTLVWHIELKKKEGTKK